MDGDRRILEHLEPALAQATPDEAAAMIAFLALERVAFDRTALSAAVRRALLVHASGGDLRRDLSFDDRAVTTLAADLDVPERRKELEGTLSALRERADGLRAAEASLGSLLADREWAWRALAAAALADHLSEIDD